MAAGASRRTRRSKKSRTANRAAAADLGQGARADQEAGEREEDRDADEPAAKRPELEVEEHHQQDGDAAHPVERGDVPAAGRLRSGLGQPRRARRAACSERGAPARASAVIVTGNRIQTWAAKSHRQQAHDNRPLARIYPLKMSGPCDGRVSQWTQAAWQRGRNARPARCA